MIFQAKGNLPQPEFVEMTKFECTNPNCRTKGKRLRPKRGQLCRKCYAPVTVTGTVKVKNPRHGVNN